MSRRPTIKDVAARAGVSIATVSRALNRRGPVSEVALRAVRRAVKATNFRANNIGRRLKTAKSGTLGIIVPSLKNPVFADAVQGIEGMADRERFSVLLTSSEYSPEREREVLDVLLANRVEGVILTVADATRSPSLDLLEREGVPFVLLFNPVTRAGGSAVTVDNVAAARDIVERLIGLGHRRIAMIAGRAEVSDRSPLRRRGYEEALRRHGLTPGPTVEVGFDTLDLEAACDDLFRGGRPPTALFCSTDMLGIAAIRAVLRRGLRVPADVSVVGFDGIAVGELISPSLATVVQPAEDMGSRAVHHLCRRIREDVPPLCEVLPYTIRSGESWGRAQKK